MQTEQALTIVQEMKLPRARLPLTAEHYVAEDGREEEGGGGGGGGESLGRS